MGQYLVVPFFFSTFASESKITFSMNIEQLEKGNELRKKIKELKASRKELLDNFNEYTGGSYGDGISVSFRRCESRTVVTFGLTDEERKNIYNLLGNILDRKIEEAEMEFMKL